MYADVRSLLPDDDPQPAADTTAPSGNGTKVGGWTPISNEAIARIPEIGLLALALLAVVAKRGSGDGRESFAKVATMAKDLGVTERAVRRARKILVEAGLLEANPRRAENGSQRSNLYSIPSCPPTTGGPYGPHPQESADSTVRVGGPYSQPPADPTVSHNKNLLNEQEPSKNKKTKAACAAEVPAKLLELIDGWNSLPAGIVFPGNGVRRNNPAKEIRSAWNAATKDPERQEHLEDIPALLEAIGGARFCHGEKWFDLHWVLTSNQKRQLSLPRLMKGLLTGDQRNGRSPKQPHPTGRGQRHPDDIRRQEGHI